MGEKIQLEIEHGLSEQYPEVLTKTSMDAIYALASFEAERLHLMDVRMKRRLERAQQKKRIDFLKPESIITGSNIRVADARKGHFQGSDIPNDLQRQWVQGTGPGTRPRSTVEKSLRNIAYALLSGADGWMFDGEDALGQLGTMSLDNQRNLSLAIHQNQRFLSVSENVAKEMNAWARGFFDRDIIQDWKAQLSFTTKIFRARGLHLDDRHMRTKEGSGFSASIVDTCLYVTNNYQALLDQGSSIVLYLPKIQTAEEAALWNRMISKLEEHLALPIGTIKTYVLIEQIEAAFQLMEIRAVLGQHFVGFNTGRWDYINSVSDAMAWDESFHNPNIDAITMTYPYMLHYEDRVRRAVNTSDINGRYALWQGGMEANIPVGSQEGIQNAMKKAIAGAKREQQEGASGKWVAHWKMVHMVRPVWERADQANQLGRKFPPLTYGNTDKDLLFELAPAPRSVRGARNLLSVSLQYGNAFEQGFQAAALKASDFFGNDNILYLMEDMATGEIRMSILWEWIHKKATFTEDDIETGTKAGDVFEMKLFARLLEDEYAKLKTASNKDVHDDSKDTTLPIAREVVQAYIQNESKPAWYIDLLNICLSVENITECRRRLTLFFSEFNKNGRRLTQNMDFSKEKNESK